MALRLVTRKEGCCANAGEDEDSAKYDRGGSPVERIDQCTCERNEYRPSETCHEAENTDGPIATLAANPLTDSNIRWLVQLQRCCWAEEQPERNKYVPRLTRTSEQEHRYTAKEAAQQRDPAN